MKIQVDLSPLGPILLDVDEAREIYRQLGDVFGGESWLMREAPGVRKTEPLTPGEIRWLTGAVGE